MKADFRRHGVRVFSSNYTLYWEMQRRHTSPAFTSRWQDLPVARTG